MTTNAHHRGPGWTLSAHKCAPMSQWVCLFSPSRLELQVTEKAVFTQKPLFSADGAF